MEPQKSQVSRFKVQPWSNHHSSYGTSKEFSSPLHPFSYMYYIAVIKKLIVTHIHIHMIYWYWFSNIINSSFRHSLHHPRNIRMGWICDGYMYSSSHHDDDLSHGVGGGRFGPQNTASSISLEGTTPCNEKGTPPPKSTYIWCDANVADSWKKLGKCGRPSWIPAGLCPNGRAWFPDSTKHLLS